MQQGFNPQLQLIENWHKLDTEKDKEQFGFSQDYKSPGSVPSQTLRELGLS